MEVIHSPAAHHTAQCKYAFTYTCIIFHARNTIYNIVKYYQNRPEEKSVTVHSRKTQGLVASKEAAIVDTLKAPQPEWRNSTSQYYY